MYSLSKRSLHNLEDVDERLVKLCEEAIKIINFDVLEGHRDKESQDNLYANGMTEKPWPKSKHNKSPATAIDVLMTKHSQNRSDTLKQCTYLAGVFHALSHTFGFKVKWSGEDVLDLGTRGDITNLNKLCHFELVE